MTGFKAEEELKKDQDKAVAAFRAKYGVSDYEWNLAVEMDFAFRTNLWVEFWKLWEESNGKRQSGHQKEEAIPRKVRSRKSQGNKQAAKSH